MAITNQVIAGGLPIKNRSINKRNAITAEIDNKKNTLVELSERTGINYLTLINRYKYGWTGSDLIKPVRKNKSIKEIE